MNYVIETTEKILYTGKNQDDIHKHFKKWEEKWGFNSTLFTVYHNSYTEFMSGIIRADLTYNNNQINRPPRIVSHNRVLSFLKLDNGDILFNIELNLQ